MVCSTMSQIAMNQVDAGMPLPRWLASVKTWRRARGPPVVKPDWPIDIDFVTIGNATVITVAHGCKVAIRRPVTG